MQYTELKTFILNKLEKELPAYLTYHNAAHTKDVLKYAEELAAAENISGNDLILLQTAALLHDSGFLETYTGHEEVSCSVARKILPDYGYKVDEIEAVCSLIMATRLPRKKNISKLAGILCDADLYYIGTDSFEKNSADLYQERLSNGLVKNRQEWEHLQIDFLRSHTYYTPAAREKLTAGLQKNLQSAERTLRFSKPVKKKGEFSLSDLILIFLGVLIAGFALQGFLVPNHFFDGGVTGISLLIQEIYHYNIAYVIVVANIPFVIAGLYSINRNYAIKTFFCIVLLGLCLYYVPYPAITSDKLLVSVFGGFFLGLGIGLTMRAGAAIDGIEVLAVYTLRRTSFTITEIILGLNIIIFSIAAFKFGIPTALYSMLTYYAASRTIDYVIEGIEAYTGVTIISGKSEIIKDRLVNEMGRGITIYKGQRGFLPGKFEEYSDCNIIFTVITRLELRKLKNLVSEIDSKAFVFASTIKEASGGVIKRRHLH
jgi:uncharacterized membrane-anchored protein YitT (DUF2179 family)